MKIFQFKYILGVLIVLLGLLYCFNYELLHYGIRQGKGQLEIVWRARSIADIRNDPSTPDSVLQKLKIIAEIKNFCEKELHLESHANYTTLYDQEEKPGMYVLSASEPYKLQSYQWEFPLLGQFSYKGYFDKELGRIEQKNLIELGYDTDLDEVNAWSTLGWFKDPVMSSMLQLHEGRLARVLIHEITHYNIFVKDDITFNENLASFIGDKGAELYLAGKYGENSPEVESFSGYLYDLDLFTQHMVHSTNELALFYDTLQEAPYRKKIKEEKIRSLLDQANNLPYRGHFKLNKIKALKNQINNAFFTDFLTYKSHYPAFSKELDEKFKGDIKTFIKDKKAKYGN